MTEYDSTHQGGGEEPGSAGAETIDLLIRHLESAKGIFSSPGGGSTQDDEELSLTLPDVLCTVIYAVPGTLCPLLYVHIPTVVEESAAESA